MSPELIRKDPWSGLACRPEQPMGERKEGDDWSAEDLTVTRLTGVGTEEPGAAFCSVQLGRQSAML
ncbi:hypothetical protein E8E15_001049, partial [Penicillium rubens]